MLKGHNHHGKLLSLELPSLQILSLQRLSLPLLSLKMSSLQMLYILDKDGQHHSQENRTNAKTGGQGAQMACKGLVTCTNAKEASTPSSQGYACKGNNTRMVAARAL